MIRLIGAILVAGGTAAVGAAAVQGLKARARLLSALIGALDIMQSELYFKLTPLPELTERLAREADAPIRPFFKKLSAGMESLGEHSFASLWEHALQACGQFWRQAEKTLLSELGGVLGRYDTEGQTRIIAYIRARLEGLLTQAEADCRQQGRVYGALGVVCGLAMVIIFI